MSMKVGGRSKLWKNLFLFRCRQNRERGDMSAWFWILIFDRLAASWRGRAAGFYSILVARVRTSRLDSKIGLFCYSL